MSIIDEGSVFIVGAGCSAPFGVPVGGSLVDDLAKQLAEEFNKATGAPTNRHPQPIRNAVSRASQFPKQFTSFPISLSVYSTAKETTHNNVEKWTADLNKLIALEKRLKGQASETIDDFIVENPDYSEITKIGIAWAIFDRLYNFENGPNQFVRKDVSARYLDDNHTRNWIHLLINIIRAGIRSGDVSSENKVKIISFNYDPILETVLDEQFSNTEVDYGRYTDYIEILHPHGAFTDFQKEVRQPARLICSWAEEISVVNEAHIPEAIGEIRQNANEWIRASGTVYAAGFAFSKPNCDMLGLNREGYANKPSPIKPTIHYCNYDGGAGLSEIVTRRAARDMHNNPVVSEQSGTLDRPLSVEQWIKGGFLGEMPG